MFCCALIICWYGKSGLYPVLFSLFLVKSTCLAEILLPKEHSVFGACVYSLFWSLCYSDFNLRMTLSFILMHRGRHFVIRKFIYP
ncbi:hypothetical protein BGZ60DRAFT_409795 [Tricladium varicosporioides]|nr:hypothetical protein BGZ60DRAFT_409795 [Hymenoscyphus varicosporioides]